MTWFRLAIGTDDREYLIKYEGADREWKLEISRDADLKAAALRKHCGSNHVLLTPYQMDLSVVPDKGDVNKEWFPSAIKLPGQRSKGKRRKNFPRGLCLHYPVWTQDPSRVRQLNQIAQNTGCSYMIIDGQGQSYQSIPMSEWGWHTGPARWKDLQPSLSVDLLGVEICSWGRVQPTPSGKFKAVDWDLLDSSEVRKLFERRDNCNPGYYHKFTDAQVEEVINLCLWLKRQEPDIFDFDYVVSHSEIAPGRKEDVGGCLDMSMDKFRALLKRRWEEVK